MMVATAPLLNYIGQDKHRAAQLYAERWDMKYPSATNRLLRDLVNQSHCPIYAADDWCVALGTHLCIVYPELYSMRVA